MKLSNEQRELIEGEILECEWRDVDSSEDLECYSDAELVRCAKRYFPELIKDIGHVNNSEAL